MVENRRAKVLSLVCLSVAQVLASAAAGLTVTIAALSIAMATGSEAIAGWGQTCTIAGAALLSVPVARAAARRGRAVSLVVAFCIAAGGSVTAAAGAALGAIVPLLAGLAAVGAGTVAALALRFAAADLSATATGRGRAVGLVLASATVGSLLGPNLAGATVGEKSLVSAFLVVAALYALAAAVSALAGSSRGSVRDEREDHGGGIGGPVAVGGRILRGPVLAAILVMAAGHAAMVALMGLAPVHLAHLGTGTTQTGVVMSVHLAAMYAASPLFGGLARRFGTARSGVLALVLAVVACIMLLAARGEVIVFGAGLAVVGFAWSLGMVSTSMALASIPLPWRLRVQGRGDLSLNVAGGAASVLAGLVVAWRGYEPLVILVGAALVVVAGFVAFLGAERRRRRPRAARDSPEVVAAAPER